MRRSAPVLLGLLVHAASAQNVPFVTVLPPAAATTAGSGAIQLPFGIASRRVMFAYEGSTLAYQHAQRITAVAMRLVPWASSSQAGSYTFRLVVSTSRNPANALVGTFDQNHGADRTEVYNGGFNTPPPTVGQNPNPFSLRIPFTVPFEWDPRSGPLLLDFDCTATAIASSLWETTNAGVGYLDAPTGASVALLHGFVAPVLRLESQAVVAPWNLANIEGNTSTGLLGNTLFIHRQDLYEPAALNWSGRRSITGLAWRTDSGGALPALSQFVTIVMSTTSRTAATMSNTFADNHGPDRKTVFAAPLAVPPSPADPDPSKFDAFIPFEQAFDHDPARGSLLIEVVRNQIAPVPAHQYDAVSGTSNVRGLVVTLVNLPTGTLSSTVPVVALRTVAIPTVPGSLANTVNTSGGSTAFPFGVGNGRVLSVVSAVEAGILQPVFVRHLRFRPDPNTPVIGPTTLTCSIDLSHAATTATTISSTFDQNHGSDRTRVFQGQFSVPFTERAANDPEFPIEVKLQRPFRWDPAQSPWLAIDLVVQGRVGNAFSLETTTGLTIADGRVTATSATATTGFVSNIAAVVQLGGVDANGLAVGYGSGCAGGNGLASCITDGLPTLPNREFRIGIRNGPVQAATVLVLGMQAATTPLPNAPGCDLLHAVEIGAVGFAVTDASGLAYLPQPLPNLPQFDGFVFRGQWLALDAGANGLGLVTSDAMEFTARAF